MSALPRRGRRPAGGDTRGAILTAARQAFGARGYDATSIRGVAAAAGVDPGLVLHYFTSKASLFAAAMDLPVDVPALVQALLATGTAGLGERLARFFLGLWDNPDARAPMLAVIRSAVSHEDAGAMLREFLTEALLGRIATALDVSTPQLRASLAGSQMIGLAMARYVVRIEPLASTDTETIVAWIAPTLQRYLAG